MSGTNGSKKYTEEEEDHEDDVNLGDVEKYEDAISKCGYGRFQHLLLLLCGWGMMSDSVELYSVSFILPPATCDLHLTSTDKGWINSSLFLGMMVGSYVWGVLADRRGRRGTLLVSLTVNALAAFAGSFVQTQWAFTFLRFISGIGVGGSLPIFYTYFGEFQPKERRGPNISVLAIFWPFGTILAAGIAWLVIPHTFGIYTEDFTYDSWRIYLTLCTIPAFTAALCLYFMPESPKFLMDKGRGDEALKVLQKVYLINHPHFSDTSHYEVFNLDRTVTGKEPFSADAADKDTEVSGDNGVKSILCELGRTTLEIFRPPILQNTLLLVTTFSMLCFGYYGLFLWLPELFSRIEAAKNGVVSNSTSNSSDGYECDYDISDTTIYVETFITSACALPGNLFTIFFVDKIGRRWILAPSMILGGLSVFCVYAVRVSHGFLIMSCIFSGVIRCAFVVCDVLEVELFPTHLRSTGAGFMCAVGRIAAILGNVTFGALVDQNMAIPLIIVACLLCFGGLISIKLPNYSKMDIH